MSIARGFYCPAISGANGINYNEDLLVQAQVMFRNGELEGDTPGNWRAGSISILAPETDFTFGDS